MSNVFHKIEIQNGRETTERIVLKTMERAMKALFKLYLSASANGVMASGIAASMTELENCEGEKPKNLTPK